MGVSNVCSGMGFSVLYIWWVATYEPLLYFFYFAQFCSLMCGASVFVDSLDLVSGWITLLLWKSIKYTEKKLAVLAGRISFSRTRTRMTVLDKTWSRDTRTIAYYPKVLCFIDESDKNTMIHW